MEAFFITLVSKKFYKFVSMPPQRSNSSMVTTHMCLQHSNMPLNCYNRVQYNITCYGGLFWAISPIISGNFQEITQLFLISQ